MASLYTPVHFLNLDFEKVLLQRSKIIHFFPKYHLDFIVFSLKKLHTLSFLISILIITSEHQVFEKTKFKFGGSGRSFVSEESSQIIDKSV